MLDRWRYRLQLVAADDIVPEPPDETERWEFVSVSTDPDGLTERRLYRKPA